MSDKVTSWISYAGAFLSVFTGLTLTEWGIIVGIVTAVLTYATNAYYQRKRFAMDQHRHELEVQYIYRARQEAMEESMRQNKAGAGQQ